jgi:hypothetical protein
VGELFRHYASDLEKPKRSMPVPWFTGAMHERIFTILRKVVRIPVWFAMEEVKAVGVDEQQTRGGRRRHQQAALKRKRK